MEAKLGSKLVAALVLMAALNFQSCKDDDSTPELVGTWKWVDGDNYQSNFDAEVEFEKDNDFTYDVRYEYNYYGYTNSVDTTLTGEWEYQNDKNEIELDIDNDPDDAVWEIEKLDDDELDIEDEEGYTYEFERQ